MFLLVALLGSAVTQRPQIVSDGTNISVTTGQNGFLQVNGIPLATEAVVTSSVNDIMASISSIQQSVQAVALNFGSSLSTIQSYRDSMQRCISVGQLWDNTQMACVSPRPDMTVYASSARMVAAEQDIDGLEAQFNQTSGTHSVCTICPRNQYMAAACTADQATRCLPCPSGEYSRGGFARQCMRCADLIPNCEVAMCTNASDAQCQYCSTTVEDASAFVLQNNGCVRCSQYSYRSSNTTCSACPKETSCAQASCQANSGMVRMAGSATMSSYYSWALRDGLSISEYMSRIDDGILTFTYGSPTQYGPHSSPDAQSNQWVQIDLGSNTRVQIDHLMFWNRDGVSGCRTFATNDGSCGAVLRGDRSWSGPNYGAIFAVSDSPLSNTTSTFITTPCTAPGQRNCRCAYLTRYNTSNAGSGPYMIPCSGATGRYVYMALPGSPRMLNFNELLVWGTYAAFTPGFSVCQTQCVQSGCTTGNARCTSGLSSAQCSPDGCTASVTAGAAYGFDSQSRRCALCTASQYRNSNGVCAACPASCSGSPCQVNNSVIIPSGTPTHGPGQYLSRGANLALDASLTTFSETATRNNPMWQVPLGSSYAIASVVLYNREGGCSSRLFTPGSGCMFGLVTPGSGNDRDFTEAGAIIRVATSPCVAGTAVCPGTICGRVLRPSSTSYEYTVNCAGGSIRGSYVSIQLPGNNRILQLGNVQINQDVESPTC